MTETDLTTGIPGRSPSPRRPVRGDRRGRHRKVPEGTRLARWGATAARHPWRIVTAWALLTVAAFAVAVAGVGGGSLFSRLTSGDPKVPGEAQTGREIIDRAEPEGSSFFLTIDGVDLRSPAVAAAAQRLVADIAAIPGVVRCVNPFVIPDGPSSPAALSMVAGQSLDSGGFMTTTSLRPGLADAEHDRAQAAVEAAYGHVGSTLPGARTAVGSGSALVTEITDQIELDLRSGEGIALPLSFVLMVVVFGGFIAAGMPVLGAIASIGGALAALYGFTYVLDLDASVVNVVTLLGLALSIDYGLLVVSRVREELRIIAPGRPARELTRAEIQRGVSRTVATAGRTVLFSGLTVAISLAGLLSFDAQIMRAIGAAGVSIVLIAMLAGLSLVPALCALSAHRLLGKGTETAPEVGVFSRLARAVRRIPWVVIVLSSVVLIALALPALSMRLTTTGAQLMPVGSPQRDFFDRFDSDYKQLDLPAATVVAETSAQQATQWAASSIEGLPHVTGTSVRQLDPAHVAVSVSVDDTNLSDTARSTVDRLRASRPAFPTWVTGQAAALADFTGEIASRAPLAIGVVVLATFVLLFLMTGSIVIPTKALLLNVLSLGASLGVVTWIFQQGHLQGPLGFSPVGGIDSMLPPLVLAFGFGLSMDYELFLISRMAELFHRGEDNDTAVEHGLQRSGRIITSAALLAAIVFSGFVIGKVLLIKQMGLALTVAIILDATVVRMLLVPATMTVLGRWNWWAPKPLREWHARHGIAE